MRLHKKGRRTLGAFVEMKSGPAYIAFRRPRDFYRNDKRGAKRSVSQSVDDGDAMWAIDLHTLREARHDGVKWLFVLMRPQKIVYGTALANYFDPERYRAINYDGRGGSDQRYLPVGNFKAVDFSSRI